MKKKLFSLTLSALLLCSTGVVASAKTISQQTNKTPASIQLAAHTHYWSLFSRTYISQSIEYQRSNGMVRSRTVYVYKLSYVCPDCGAQKTETSYQYTVWSSWVMEM